VIAEIQTDYGTAISRLEESLLLQESILAERNYMVRTTKYNLNRVIERAEPEPGGTAVIAEIQNDYGTAFSRLEEFVASRINSS
jgi:hypothetical protein